MSSAAANVYFTWCLSWPRSLEMKISPMVNRSPSGLQPSRKMGYMATCRQCTVTCFTIGVINKGFGMNFLFLFILKNQTYFLWAITVYIFKEKLYRFFTKYLNQKNELVTFTAHELGPINSEQLVWADIIWGRLGCYDWDWFQPLLLDDSHYRHVHLVVLMGRHPAWGQGGKQQLGGVPLPVGWILERSFTSDRSHL